MFKGNSSRNGSSGEFMQIPIGGKDYWVSCFPYVPQVFLLILSMYTSYGFCIKCQRQIFVFITFGFHQNQINHCDLMVE